MFYRFEYHFISVLLISVSGVCSEIPYTSILFILRFNLLVALLYGNCNLWQNIVEKSTKLSNTDFQWNFTADFLQFCRTNVKIFPLDGRLSTCQSIASISGICLRFSNSLRSYVLSRSATRETTPIFIFW